MGAIQNRFTSGKLVIRSDATCLQEERIGPEPDGWAILMCHGGIRRHGPGPGDSRGNGFCLIGNHAKGHSESNLRIQI